MMQRVEIKVKGAVQGVGFRPFIYSLATKYLLNGFVLNNTEGVIIEVEGEKETLKKFTLDITQSAPPLSRIEKIQTETLPITGYKTFTIKPSSSLVVGNRHACSLLISPDIAICDECLHELFDPSDRRFGYPFINCTNCGPRFTIIKDIPYDREKTTMHKFKMCNLCQEEYENPQNRRFHAQPNACPSCGPKVELVEADSTRDNNINHNQKITPTKNACSTTGMRPERSPINETVKLLKQGKIVAIKGLGGFHLACDAQNQEAVASLRRKKYREEKPFAIMAKNLEIVKSFCSVNECEEKLLNAERRPIVLLKKKKNSLIADEVAPKQKYYGVMLPYTPLHHLLFSQLRGETLRGEPLSTFNYELSVLVMTSGNISDEPISYKNEEALSRLNHIADYFLLNDREIHIRCDDSVTRCFLDKEMLIRRARGYVPEPIELPFKLKNPILSCGAELKNTFCVAKDNYAFVSHHIGDLENLETLTSFEQGIEHYKNLFSINPEIIAYDLHPEYLSTKYAQKLTTLIRSSKATSQLRGKPLSSVGVQHHHAHIVSCMVENKINEKVIGVAFDGLGYGTDGTLWGGEFLVTDFLEFKRVGHFKYVPMPGGVEAIKEPYRMAFSYLYQIYGDNAFDLEIDFTKRIDRKKCQALTTLINRHINSPVISSVGRLFDAISSLIGVRDKVNYEGQAAIELEMIVDKECSKEYNYEIKSHNSMLIVEPAQIFAGIIEDLKFSSAPSPASPRRASSGRAIISAKFHNTIANIIEDVLIHIRDTFKLNKVVLSGGVFQNMILLHNTVSKLQKKGFNIYTHHRVPPNDGGISLGQTVIANARILCA